MAAENKCPANLMLKSPPLSYPTLKGKANGKNNLIICIEFSIVLSTRKINDAYFFTSTLHLEIVIYVIKVQLIYALEHTTNIKVL